MILGKFSVKIRIITLFYRQNTKKFECFVLHIFYSPYFNLNCSDGELQPDNDEEPQITLQIERKRRIELDDSGSDSELSDTEIERRRQRLKNKSLQQRRDEEVLAKEEEKQSESSDESSYEEESESEEENEPRLKPLFVSRKDRATIAEKEKELQKQKQMDHDQKRLAKERRRQTLRMVEESVKKDLEKAKVILMIFSWTHLNI